MLPHGGYFHDVLYNIRTTDENTITMTTGDMQVGRAARSREPCGGSPLQL
jgi:hypothetical protein